MDHVVLDLARIQKDAGTEIRILVSLHNGKKYLVLREFWRGDDGAYWPSKRAGINISERFFSKVLEAVRDGLAALADGAPSPADKRSRPRIAASK